MPKDTQKILALAGVFQAAQLVTSLASTGKLDKQAYECIIDSLFFIDANDIATIYSGVDNLAPGLECMQRAFTKNNRKEQMLTSRYALSLLLLEKKLTAKPKYYDIILKHIQQAKIQRQHFECFHPQIIANLADAYIQTIGLLTPKIRIVGNQSYLTNKDNLNQIRALLLGGIRSAVLWRQLGGRLPQILFSRRKTSNTVKLLLKNFKEQLST